MKIMAKIHDLDYELLHHPPYSSDLTPSDFFLFAELKWMLGGKKFSVNEYSLSGGYFEGKENSHYENVE